MKHTFVKKLVIFLLNTLFFFQRTYVVAENNQFLAPLANSKVNSLILEKDKVTSLQKRIIKELKLKDRTSKNKKKLHGANFMKIHKGFYHSSETIYRTIWGIVSKKKSSYSDTMIPTIEPKLVCIGPLFFLDKSMVDKLSHSLREEIHPNLIIIEDLKNNELVSPAGNYTATTITAMLQNDFKDVTCIDGGAGSGILSLVASKLGAKKLILIEKDITGEWSKAILSEKGDLKEIFHYASRNLMLNGLSPSKDFTLLNIDMSEVDLLVENINQISPLSRNFSIISDIAAWVHFPITNITSIKLLYEIEKQIPGAFVSSFIAGGYDAILGYPENWQESRNEHLFMEKLGFNHKIKSISKYSFFSSILNLILIKLKFKKVESILETVKKHPYATDKILLTALGFQINDNIFMADHTACVPLAFVAVKKLLNSSSQHLSRSHLVAA